MKVQHLRFTFVSAQCVLNFGFSQFSVSAKIFLFYFGESHIF